WISVQEPGVGWQLPPVDRQHRRRGFDGSRCAESVPGDALDGRHRRLPLEHPGDDAALRAVVQFRTGSVGVDVSDVGRLQTRIGEGEANGALGAIALRVGGGYV